MLLDVSHGPSSTIKICGARVPLVIGLINITLLMRLWLAAQTNYLLLKVPIFNADFQAYLLMMQFVDNLDGITLVFQS